LGLKKSSKGERDGKIGGEGEISREKGEIETGERRNTDRRSRKEKWRQEKEKEEKRK
jgi:hypothetical protein